MKKQRIQTTLGWAEYYTMDDVYEANMGFYVKLPDMDSEYEFVVPKDKIGDDKDVHVYNYIAGFQQGRHVGRWEKGRKLRDLFDEIKRLTN
jgi:hypothetical protein